MTEQLVEALWVGSHPAELPNDRRVLQSGVDTAMIGRHEAETSDNWQIVDAKTDAPKTAAKPAKAGD